MKYKLCQFWNVGGSGVRNACMTAMPSRINAELLGILSTLQNGHLDLMSVCSTALFVVAIDPSAEAKEESPTKRNTFDHI